MALILGSFVGAALEKRAASGMALVVSGAVKAIVSLLIFLVKERAKTEVSDCRLCIQRDFKSQPRI